MRSRTIIFGGIRISGINPGDAGNKLHLIPIENPCEKKAYPG
jgi:hypothetical protein